MWASRKKKPWDLWHKGYDGSFFSLHIGIFKFQVYSNRKREVLVEVLVKEGDVVSIEGMVTIEGMITT